MADIVTHTASAAAQFNGEYYSTLAQVIPVIFIVIALESSVIKRVVPSDRELRLSADPAKAWVRWTWARRAWLTLTVFIALVGAEATVLDILGQHRTATWADKLTLTMGLMWAGVVAIAMPLWPLVRFLAMDSPLWVALYAYGAAVLVCAGLLTTSVFTTPVFIACVALIPAAGFFVYAVFDDLGDALRAIQTRVRRLLRRPSPQPGPARVAPNKMTDEESVQDAARLLDARDL